MSGQGRFITLEGVEGSGKSTLARRLADAIAARGLVVVATREPGGTPLAEQVRAVALARSSEPMPPAAELLLMFAARSIHVENRIRPALARGEWVLCDRFTDATRAYQGAGRGLSLPLIETLARASHPDLIPDRTLLLDLPAEIGLARARSRADGGDRFEDEALAFFNRVRGSYLEMASREPARFRVIDASRGPDEVLFDAVHALGDLWP